MTRDDSAPSVSGIAHLPRFVAARRAYPKLLAIGIALATLGTFLPNAIELAAAAAWLAAGGFFSAAMLAYVRARLLDAEVARADAANAEPLLFSDDTPAAKLALILRALARAKRWLPGATAAAEWGQAAVVVACGIIAVLEIVQWWRNATIPSGSLALEITSGALLVAAFPLLVLQQTYAAASSETLPDAPRLERLLRLPLIACAGIGVTMIALAGGFDWAMQIQNVLAVVLTVAAIELIVRGLATMFIPWPAIDTRTAVADSALAGFLLRLKLPNWNAVNLAVRNQLGINLSRSWALAFLRRGLLPLAIGVAVASWLFTGVTALGINQRGIYERFGKPVAVLDSGLHIHLPWPFGTLRVVETGVVHQLPIEFLLPDSNGRLPEEEKTERVAAEAPAPEEADRLWDDAHPYEGSYLIASEENNRQSFQLVDVDMAVVYQTGTSDEAARDAAYRVGDTEALVQSLSGQILVRFLSEHQLLELLGESRETLSAEFRARLQKQLDQFNAGVEVLTVSMEAIHPPPGAATAYHNVQAAEIRASTDVAQARGNAAQLNERAQQAAAQARNEAQAAAVERVAQAKTTAALFDGERQAYAKDGQAFLMERWFDALKKIADQPELLLIDYRLKGQASPTLDLRSPSAPPIDRTLMRE